MCQVMMCYKSFFGLKCSNENPLPCFVCDIDFFYEIYFPEIKMGLGELPKEYNKAVHGPYDPAVFYGKKDVPLGQVKLQDVPAWFSRRNKSPAAAVQAMSRAYWR